MTKKKRIRIKDKNLKVTIKNDERKHAKKDFMELLKRAITPKNN